MHRALWSRDPLLTASSDAVQVLAHVPPMQRERVAQLLMSQGYLRKVLDMFRVSSSSVCFSNAATSSAVACSIVSC